MRLSPDISSYIDANAPLAIAVSGGGDSMALLGLLIAAAQGRTVHALIVDHGLRDSSAKEATRVAAWAYALGAHPQILRWTPPKLTSAVQEQARIARYGLMGQACRKLGVSKLFVGHTQDDQIETYIMREGKRASWRGLAGMRMVTYAPVWPQLYGIEVVRPLLSVPRMALRKYNEAKDIPWLEDPSNINMDFERVRVRTGLAGDTDRRATVLSSLATNAERRDEEQTALRAIATSVTWKTSGVASFDMVLIQSAVAAPMLSRLLACVSGAAYMPDMHKTARLLSDIMQERFTSAGLSGALVTRSGNKVCVFLEPPRGHRPALNVSLISGKPICVAGRYLITAAKAGLVVKSFWPARTQLPHANAAALKAMPALARRGVMGVFAGEGLVAVPQLGYRDEAIISGWKDLGAARFLHI